MIVRVYTEAEIGIVLDRCGKGQEGYPVWIRESHEELRRQLVALQSALATSEAARERAEATLKVIELGAGDAVEKTDIAHRYFARAEENQ